LSPLRDRLDYFYFLGAEEYFHSRIAKHGGATVLRVNMPPGPLLSGDPRVVAVLDARSFRVLLDDSRVDKDGTLDGTYMPSLALFGGHRPLAFLDGADPRHAALKRCGPELHARLATEVRVVVPSPGTTITLSDVEKMPLVKSFVWETLRMNPPVEFQYGRARRDTVVESHDAAYEVKKGEMVFGYQPLATRDERVFQRGREFVPDRFAVCSDDDERRRMLEHVVWSNGPETGAAAEGNKQCPGKDAVVAVGRLMVAELLPHATAGRRHGSLLWTLQASATSARRSSTRPRLLLT